MRTVDQSGTESENCQSLRRSLLRALVADDGRLSTTQRHVDNSKVAAGK